MSKINKTNNGLLFFDDFSEKTLMWTQSPSDRQCLSFGDNGLQIQHNDHYITYTITEPSLESYSCIVKLNHTPRTEKDIAGVIIMSTAKDYAECQSYMATESSSITNGSQEQFSGDIQNIVNAILNERLENYIEYSIDDGSITPISTYSTSDTTTITTPTGFIDTLYKYIKFHKEKNLYRFFASSDGLSWIEVGNTAFNNTGVIGLFLYGTEEQDVIDNSHCFFNYFALYTSKYIIINNIDSEHEIEIYDENGNILICSDDILYMPLINKTNKKVIVNTTTLPMPIKNMTLRVFLHDDYNTTIYSHELGEVYGGDEFTIERDIRLFIDNNEITPYELYDLGAFNRGSQYVKLDLYNHEDYILNDVKVKIIRYSEYYSGGEEIAVALYDENQVSSSLEYKKEVVIDKLEPTTGRSVLLKLIDRPIQDYYMTANSYRFKIIIE